MKEDEFKTECLTADEFIESLKEIKPIMSTSKALFVLGGFLIILFSGFLLTTIKNTTISELNTEDNILIAVSPSASTGTKRDLISIPSGTVKANPFLPYRNIDGMEDKINVVDDVPQYELVDPPEFIDSNSDASRIMNTVVSGIMYDKHSPSAILNIEGSDYLVKNGDVINNYKVIAINQDSVTVKLGNNTYKAGIGEILSDGEIRTNDVSNLNKKFGGKKNEI